jgi:hypothetical protein
MSGRKPIGPQLVHHLDGSELAKERLEIILETVAGKRTIHDASELLGISEARFFQLRTQVLQAGLSRLEPRPAGRPSQTPSPEDQRIAELEQEIREKDSELKATGVRLEIAQTMPQLVQDETLKKTNTPKQRRKLAAKRERRRRK